MSEELRSYYISHSPAFDGDYLKCPNCKKGFLAVLYQTQVTLRTLPTSDEEKHNCDLCFSRECMYCAVPDSGPHIQHLCANMHCRQVQMVRDEFSKEEE